MYPRSSESLISPARTSKVVSTKQNAAATAQTLAGAGYIITAIGGNDVDGVVMVGTKVAGDSLARPFLAIPSNQSPIPLTQNGYAVVGLIVDDMGGIVSWLGEK